MNVESTLNQRLNLIPTLIQHCFNVVCPVGSKLVQWRTVPCLYSIQAEDKRTCRQDIYRHFLMSNVVKDWLPFPTRSCILMLATYFPIRFKLLVLSHPVSTYAFGRLSQNLTPCTTFYNNGIYRDVTLPVDGRCAMTSQHVHNGGEHMPLLHACIVVWSDDTDVLVVIILL
jgi:hypothetical protein